MHTVRELKDWLSKQKDTDLVGLDEDGICLMVYTNDPYYEIGEMFIGAMDTVKSV